MSMSAKELLASALELTPAERFELGDEFLHSLDRPAPELDRVWNGLAANRRGEVQGTPAKDGWTSSNACGVLARRESRVRERRASRWRPTSGPLAR